ncbi:MAG: 4-vinyl reductase [Chloroflexi bacterium]|nr:4-vinyl reductase [Chloroflexota bacterium]
MSPITRSGYNLPNRIARTSLLALEEMVGKGDVQELLLMAQLDHLIDHLPSSNLELGFDFAEFGALVQALENKYGERGGRGLALRAGRSIVSKSLSGIGSVTGFADPWFKALPPGAKTKWSLRLLARISNYVSDQRARVEQTEDAFHYVVVRNPVCWGRRDEERPVCYLHVGMLQQALHPILTGKEVRIDEAECKAMGALACRFVIQKDLIS